VRVRDSERSFGRILHAADGVGARGWSGVATNGFRLRWHRRRPWRQA